jgi:hypothetical protein
LKWDDFSFDCHLCTVIPAKAGIQFVSNAEPRGPELVSRFRGNDGGGFDDDRILIHHAPDARDGIETEIPAFAGMTRSKKAWSVD